jgi:hypothetical protein
MARENSSFRWCCIIRIVSLCSILRVLRPSSKLAAPAALPRVWSPVVRQCARRQRHLGHAAIAMRCCARRQHGTAAAGLPAAGS